MLGFLIGTACLIGLVRVLRRGPGARGFGLGRRRMLNRIFTKLETSPSQEKAVVAAVDSVEGALRGLRAELDRSREELARLLREESADKAALDGLHARQEVAVAELRQRFAEAFETVHTTLDRDQRAALARLVERGPCSGRAFRHRQHAHQGPYRDAASA